ncbi:hypothetical protein CAEBREN_12743 [Caenorhabditis brenneri]|uniref:DNA2/NAM7 helicase-like C-terminal domain-containing protein n=1 Tax=Caenorhabditis brenneri TaxID=135651 RepID=G0N2A8_CAEBE|nr:hypothetical protein CAEBREN_12743 [Caenorhabditis brenneri]
MLGMATQSGASNNLATSSSAPSSTPTTNQTSSTKTNGTTTTKAEPSSSTSTSNTSNNGAAAASSSSCSTACGEPVLDPFNPDEETIKEYSEQELRQAIAEGEEAFKVLPESLQDLIRQGRYEILTDNIFTERTNEDGTEWKEEAADNRIEPTEGRQQVCHEEEQALSKPDIVQADIGDNYKRDRAPDWNYSARDECENHQWYPAASPQEKLPKDKVKRLVASETPERVALFLRHFVNQQNVEEKERLEDHPENETVYTTVPPSERSVLYMAVEYLGGSYYLTPIHLEVVGGKRPSLHYITLNQSSFDMASNKCFNMDQVEIGDIFMVDEIIPNPSKKREPMITDMAYVDDPKHHKFWKVRKAARVPRTLAKDKIALHWIPKDSQQRNAYLVEDLVSPALLSQRLTPPKFVKAREQWLEVTVMTPPVQPGRNIRGYDPGSEEEDALELFRPHCPVWNIGPRIIESRPLSKESKELIDEGVMQFSENGQLEDRSFQRAARLIRFGAYAQTAMVNYRYDPRSYSGFVTETTKSQFGYTLDINLKNPTTFPIQTTQWRSGTMVTVKRNQTIIPGRILSVIDYKDGRFRVIIRLAKRYNVDMKFYFEQTVFVQHKSQDMEEYLRMQVGRMVPPDYTVNMTAMRVWAATLGADPITDREERRVDTSYRQGDFTSTAEQGRVLEYMNDRRVPGVIVHCAFGAGKTTTLVTSILHHLVSHPKAWVAYTAQSNMAVVQAVKTWEKWDRKKEVRAVRLMTAANRDRIDNTQHTLIDLPVLLWQVLHADFQYFNFSGISQAPLNIAVTRHLEAHKRIAYREIRSKTLRDACRASYKKDPPTMGLHECFVKIYKPTLFFGTTTSLRQTFSNNDFMNSKKDKISVIAVDESSQLPRASFTALVFTFPKSRMFLTGDSKQLPPYSETNTPKELEDFAGAWFQRAFDKKVLPVVSISTVFRCPPYITKWLSETFYNSTLSPPNGLYYETNELGWLRFPSPSPLQFINTVSEESRDGTSTRNLKEALVCKKLVDQLLQFIDRRNVAVVCFYLSQVSLLAGLLPRGVHVTTVDGVQGAEFDYVVVCTTRSLDFPKSRFVNSKERTNVALSRSKKVTFVLANRSATHNSKDCWNKIYLKVPEEACPNLSDLPAINPSERELSALADSLRESEHTYERASERGPFSPRR